MGLPGTLDGMGFFAPRISNRPVREIERLADRPYRSAEIYPLVGKPLRSSDIAGPSYDQVRLLVRQRRRAPKRVSTAEVLLDIGLRARHPNALVEHVSGVNTHYRRK